MLLSYIDYLVSGKSFYNSYYEIYNALVEKWLIREADKRKKRTERDEFIYDLYHFSFDIAKYIYVNSTENPNLSIDTITAGNICYDNNYKLSEYEITGQSLLTRDIRDNWKFAHKSILEFFLAKHIKNDFKLYNELKSTGFYGWDMTEKFCDDCLFVDMVLANSGYILDDENYDSTDNYVDEFYYSQFPVDITLWDAVFDNSNNKNKALMGNLHPELVLEFIYNLNEKTGNKFRFLTEKEWEYLNRKNIFLHNYKDYNYSLISQSKNQKQYYLATKFNYFSFENRNNIPKFFTLSNPDIWEIYDGVPGVPTNHQDLFHQYTEGKNIGSVIQDNRERKIQYPFNSLNKDEERVVCFRLAHDVNYE
jgi:hypothetical protein